VPAASAPALAAENKWPYEIRSGSAPVLAGFGADRCLLERPEGSQKHPVRLR